MSNRPYVKPYQWELSQVRSPHISAPVNVVAVKNIPYVPNANRFQNFNIYLPDTANNNALIGKPILDLGHEVSSGSPSIHVHIHGGAWRDPLLSSRSIEAEVAHAFSDKRGLISSVVSLNYTLSPFPTHPFASYDPAKGDSGDSAREAQHPMHIHDILHAFSLLKEFGLRDESYILSGHSCGAFLAFQASLFPPGYWGFDGTRIPTPAALLGMNALLDLSDLVYHLGDSHKQLGAVYKDLQAIAFGNESSWDAASPGRVDSKALQELIACGQAPGLVMLDQSINDQLVPVSQTDKMETHLAQVKGLRVVRGHRCTGVHAAPWEQGYMIWECITDVLKTL